MKSIVFLLAGVGLVSAQVAVPSPIAVQGAPVDPNAIASSGLEGSAGLSSASLSGAFGADSSLNLGSLDVGGVNLGSLDFNNEADIINAIELMMNALCLGNLVQVAQLQQLSQVAALEMFLELAQLMDFFNSGALNLFDVNDLFNSGFNSGISFGGFNLGNFKRAVANQKRTLTRSPETRRIQIKRQSCQAGSIVGADGQVNQVSNVVAPASGAASAIPAIGTVSPDLAAAGTVAAIAPAQTVAAASVASVAAAPVNVAPSSSSDDEPLSDFTR